MKLFIVAGEASGDQLGARLLADLRAQNPDMAVRGVGGSAMAVHGVQSIFRMQDLSLMGLAEVLPKIPKLLQRLSDTEKAVKEFQPDIVITIDAPDFSKRLARRLQPLRRAGKVKLVHYVAPTVWAWRPGRAKKMAALFDHLLCLFPFEPPYFEAVGLPATFVGHPIAMNPHGGDAARLREKLSIRPDQPVVCLLPGSRAGEVKKLLPVFLETFEKLKQQQPDLVGVLPTLPGFEETIRKSLLSTRRGESLFILSDPQDKWDAFALAAGRGGAIAASGTVSLELAAAGCPHLVAYKMHPLTYWIARALIKTPFVNLVNILAGCAVVPEVLQQDVTPENIRAAYHGCLQHAAAQKAAFAQQLEKLKAPMPDVAARTVFALYSRK